MENFAMSFCPNLGIGDEKHDLQQQKTKSQITKQQPILNKLVSLSFYFLLLLFLNEEWRRVGFQPSLLVFSAATERLD